MRRKTQLPSLHVLEFTKTLGMFLPSEENAATMPSHAEKFVMTKS